MIQSSVEDGVARVHLDSPQTRNALSKDLSDALAAAVRAVEGDAGALVLTAEPPAFCAGGNLDDLIEPKGPLASTYAGFLALASCPIPTIAVVDGAAIGAGVNLPLACDVVIAGPNATFDPRWLDVGIHPGGGHFHRLERRVGRQGAAALVLCGDTLTGEDAATFGLAWRYSDDPLSLAMTFARRAARRDRDLVVRAKQTLDTEADDYLALELEAQQWSVDRPGFVDGVRKIKESLGEPR